MRKEDLFVLFLLMVILVMVYIFTGFSGDYGKLTGRIVGDGILDEGEECDDNNTINETECDYGDQVCDDTTYCNAEGTAYLTSLPSGGYCGDGVNDTSDEECDDGNTADGDGCSAICEIEEAIPECGNGVVEGEEECDEEDFGDITGCSDLEGFNGGVLSCDDSCQFNTSLCTFCGDGIINGDEECDDGNDAENDLCSNVCVLTSCGDGVIQDPNSNNVSEQCDDGNIINETECDYGSATCESTYCQDDCLAWLTDLTGSYCGDDTCDSGDEDCDSCDADCGVCEDDDENGGEDEEESTTIETTTEPTTPTTTQLTATDISSLTLNPNDTEQITWSVKNTGTEPVSACKLKPLGDFASWISPLDETKNLNQGEEKTFVFDLIIPEETEEGSYLLSASVECFKTTASKDFAVEVIKKKLEFDIIDAQRTRATRVRVIYSLEELSGNDQVVEVQFSLLDLNNQEVANASQNRSIAANSTREFRINIPINESLEGNLSLLVNFNSEIYSSSVQEKITLGAPIGGFAIFGEGIGTTGSIIILVVIVLVLGIVFLVVRKIRKSEK